MFRPPSLTTVWVVAWVVLAAAARTSVTTNCLQLVSRDFWQHTEYEDTSQQLAVHFNQSNNKLRRCLNGTRAGTTYLLQLVQAGAGAGAGEQCCDMECGAAVQDQLPLAAHTAVFRYVRGTYFLRLVRVTSEGGGTCEEGSFSSCSSVCGPAAQYGPAPCPAPALDTPPANTTADTVVINQSYHDQDEVCTFEISAAVAVCGPVPPYAAVNVSTVEVPLNFSCSDLDILDWDNFEVNTTVEQVSSCDSALCPARYSAPGLEAGLVTFRLRAPLNTSHCALLRLAHPSCRDTEAAAAPHCTLALARPAVCSPDTVAGAGLAGAWLTQPMFMAIIITILLTCLALLLWIVVKCAQDQVSSLSSSPEPEKDIYKNKNMPRSLTIDEMEHICRLRQQELILVYFPDTEMFKTLNRRFRDWLLSLNILNVNDVIDIYDEKFSESPDGFLKNPDGWVSNLLSDPERRVVLVTSKLAYECLIHMRKGLDPPKFPENDNYSKLLVHILKYLDSDMFKGNYRRLICVRYEDLKICDRRYGSESFNIVPGTEYLLPQHLEDIARWIHPVEARPGLWADHRPQVRHLMEYIKDYRLREDNIFTVSFYNGEERPLLTNGYYPGY